ncbi:LacI family DNA-binding transcriptional regulator [Aureibacillus halotolerans]|uniref:LacI family transcriptional regulator n=1 Tax=Aureibacillus halotolerans TaxID=1508390 RepID=A0A4R6TST0_9BACI|nr:LacI family DNA-binding transcriptional regulator [Aureibacillus halotolerans]TDQ36371.1 LacI family transcriptional regulator [Aureibacillus halotolerans]
MKIDDIAKLANVSKSAVSLALNGKKGVSAETRKKIIEIAHSHGYITRPLLNEPMKEASSKLLRLVVSINAGIVTEQYDTLPFFTEFIHSLDKTTGSKGYSLIVSPVRIESMFEDIRRLEFEQKSAGILFLGTNLTKEHMNIIPTLHSNMIVLDTCFPSTGVNFIVMNNELGAHQAVQHLLNLGHTTIGYVESTTRMYNFEMRKKAFLQALADQDLQISKQNFFHLPPTDITSQKQFEKELAGRNDLPTALFCECDYMAISTIKSITNVGLRVPDDISVVGFDNIFESKVVTPELTTIHVKKDKIASLAVEKLIRANENEEENDTLKILVDTELVIRESSALLVNSQQTHQQGQG